MFLLSTLLATVFPFCLGATATLLFGRKHTNILYPGLLFHSVTPEPKELSHYSVTYFRHFCELLEQNQFMSYPLRTVPFSTPLQNQKKPILLTFDDGLQSIYQHALPILIEYHFKTTIFCLSGFYGKKSSWDVFSHNIHLTKQQIRELHGYGHEIGSHTCSHSYLPFLSVKEQQRELTDSKKELEDIIGAPVKSISFPYGGWNSSIWQCAQKVGYQKATLYRKHTAGNKQLYPVQGVYRFDTPADIISKIQSPYPLSIIRARTSMMAHFAKGTPVWMYRKNYNRF